MATKKATYKYDNGTGWDEIMFKTTADQVVESTTKRFVTDAEKSNWNTAVTRGNDWNSFKTGGGKIGGHVQLNKGNSFVIDGVGWIGTGSATEFEMIQTNKGKVVRLGTTDNLGNHIFMGLDGNDGVFGPSHNNLVDLGKPTNTFKDLWLGSSNKSTNGYTKLPNGIILQWGRFFQDIPSSGGEVKYDFNYPITFPNFVAYVDCSAVFNQTLANHSWLTPIRSACVPWSNTGASAVNASMKTMDRSYNILFEWIAIGY